MAILDLSEWIDQLEKEGEVARVKEKVDWNLELGGNNPGVIRPGRAGVAV